MADIINDREPYFINIAGSRIQVVETRGGFTISIMIAPASSDDLWESVSLATCLFKRETAEKIVASIRKKGKIDLRYWLWSPSVCSPYGFMHATPPLQLGLAEYNRRQSRIARLA